MTEDEMVGWHHQLNGHEFKKASGEDEQQGSLAFSSPWSCKESVTEQQQQNYLFCGQMKQVASPGSMHDTGCLGLEKTLESPLDRKEIKPVNSKGNQP